jgi:2-methylisocitrate lyase-like PEP mutase family enzyme
MTAPIGRLRALLAADHAGRRTLMSVPGCWDGLSALLIEHAGFPAAFVSGGALSMARLGRPDMGLTTATEAIETIAAIRDRVTLPLIADGDTGFGNAVNLARTIRGFERAGASAIQIEDQGFPKRCGHMAGKSVVPPGEAVGRIKAALDTREAMLVIARTDALALEGIAAALDRADAYLEAGADAIFVEGPRTVEELAAIARRFAARVPLVHNLVEGGISPTDSGAELARMGFAVALHPLLLLHGFVRHAPDWLAQLRRERSTAGLSRSLVTLGDMNALLGARELIDFERRHGG